MPKRARPAGTPHHRVHHSNAAAGAHPRQLRGGDEKTGRRSSAQKGASAAYRWWPTITPSARWRCTPDHERAFDEGHLELLRVLASEASIAIENRPLVQRRGAPRRGNLSLLNTISRNAIATLNPDEMLAKITEQLEAGLTYDHIGIGVLATRHGKW